MAGMPDRIVATLEGGQEPGLAHSPSIEQGPDILGAPLLLLILRQWAVHDIFHDGCGPQGLSHDPEEADGPRYTCVVPPTRSRVFPGEDALPTACRCMGLYCLNLHLMMPEYFCQVRFMDRWRLSNAHFKPCSGGARTHVGICTDLRSLICSSSTAYCPIKRMYARDDAWKTLQSCKMVGSVTGC